MFLLVIIYQCSRIVFIINIICYNLCVCSLFYLTLLLRLRLALFISVYFRDEELYMLYLRVPLISILSFISLPYCFRQLQKRLYIKPLTYAYIPNFLITSASCLVILYFQPTRSGSKSHIAMGVMSSRKQYQGI